MQRENSSYSEQVSPGSPLNTKVAIPRNVKRKNARVEMPFAVLSHPSRRQKNTSPFFGGLTILPSPFCSAVFVIGVGYYGWDKCSSLPENLVDL